METTHFLLAPDKHAALALRRRLAEDGRGLGATAGTWPEFISLVKESCLNAPPKTNWRDAVGAAAAVAEDAFWGTSLDTATDETVDALDSALLFLLRGQGPDAPRIPDGRRFNGRLAGVLSDLARLHDALDRRLPEELGWIREVIDAPAGRWIRHIRIHHLAGWPRLDPWQQALVEQVNARAEVSGDAFEAILAAQSDVAPAAPADTALGCLQRDLFKEKPHGGTLDQTVRWLGLRDSLEEAEVAAQMIGRMLDEDAELEPKEIGLLLPNDPSYAAAIGHLTKEFSLPLSGLEILRHERNHGMEAVHLFLRCLWKPSPDMALAALVTSSIMPWSEPEGRTLAQEVFSCHGAPRERKGPEAWGHVRRLLLSEPAGPDKLRARLGVFAKLLKDGMLNPAEDRGLAEAVGRTMGHLSGASDIPWRDLLKRTRPCPVPIEADGRMFLEHVTVFTEGREPVRTVRHLLVLGVSAGRYPAAAPEPPVFSRGEVAELVDAGLGVRTGEMVRQERRLLFRRQLCVVTDSVTFLTPRLSFSGESVSPSETLDYMARLFASGKKLQGEDLIRDLDAEEADVRWVQRPEPTAPDSQWTPALDDLAFDRDLLMTDGESKPAAESPSSLEKLMISPLAWLLYRLHLQPPAWTPPTLDPAIQGTLAHRVFEVVFPAGAPLPNEEEVRRRVPPALEDAFRRKAPSLIGPERWIERMQLERECIEAALHWCRLLAQTGARLVANEVWLSAEFGDLRIHGRADSILTTEGGLLVVDYKKSSSGKREASMRKGFDTQARLYLDILRMGELPEEETELRKAAAEADRSGIVYFTMNDQTALANLAEGIGFHGPSVVIVEGPVHERGMERISAALDRARKGFIRLNRRGELQRFQSETGIDPQYTLGASPLSTLFVRPDEEVAS